MVNVIPSVSTGRARRAPGPQQVPRPRADQLTLTATAVTPNVLVIAVHGEVDLCTSPVLHDGLLAHLHHAAKQMIIDLTGVGFLGAAGVTVLAAISRAAVKSGIGLHMVARTRTVLLPLTFIEPDHVFDIYPDLADALLRLGGGPDG